MGDLMLKDKIAPGQKRHNISGDVASFSCKLGMSAATVIPLVHASKNGIHECARCFGPATTRCSRCKVTLGMIKPRFLGLKIMLFQNFDYVLSKEEIPRRHNVNICGGFSNGHTSSRSTMHRSHDLQSQHGNILDSRTNFGISDLLCSTKPETIVCDIERDFMSEVAGIRDAIPQQGSNKDASMGIMKMFGLRKSIEAW
ncbi:hypothetical protein LOK49_LG07G00424 [Camellia lanceoleosa]|uniref:Uncharacterized protein n=1 Tax=Camellia lanceoleosa TaxID=1840588 RepID=A0ACC0H2V6_9ERIC|nr:hypothetical protein LOK49_LG07G00424 [Camellia lanceoleosa]